MKQIMSALPDVVLLGCTERVAHGHLTGEGHPMASRWQRKYDVKKDVSG